MIQSVRSAPCSFSKLLAGFDKGFHRRCIRLSNDKTDWQIYLEQDELIYATNSLQSLERLERHLKRISRGNHEGIKPLSPWVRSQLDVFYETESHRLTPDYRSIQWLVSQNIISATVASLLVQRISLEVLETALLWNDRNWQHRIELLGATEPFPTFEKSKLSTVVDQLYHRLLNWQKIVSAIHSPYQRPYFSNNQQALRRISPDTMEKLTRLLKGFNFRQLSALLNQDEFMIAERLYPLVKEGVIVLRDPEPPFDDLPYLSINNLSSFFPNIQSHTAELSQKSVASSRSKPNLLDDDEITIGTIHSQRPPAPETKSLRSSHHSSETIVNSSDHASRLTAWTDSPRQVWKVVCVDDSEAMLQEISRLLDNESLSITTISDPTKALMKICTIAPDIVLLDVGMPGIDGYQICQLIRKVPRLKDIPIVMVTGNKGLIDRAKARLAGATDYLTKPFDQQELIAMVFRYLS